MMNEEYIVYKNWGFDDLYMNMIYSYIQGFKGQSYVSNEKLSSIMCCSIRTIKIKIKELEDGGYIKRIYSQNNRFRLIKITEKKIRRRGNKMSQQGGKK